MVVKSAEKKENSTVELVIEVGREEFDEAVNRVYLKNRNSINIPGFRKGKAPRKLIENMYGSGIFYEDAVNEVYPVAYSQAVMDQKLDAVGYPEIEVESVGPEGLVFKAIVSVKPEVTLSQYKGLVAPKSEVKITDAELDAEMRPLIARATRMVDVDREARNGDTAMIDFEGFLNGEPFEGGKGEKYNLQLGSNTFVPGFEEQIVGMKAGDEKEINIKFPDNYTPELAGKDVVFKVKLHAVKTAVQPKVDDEFAKDVSEFDTLEELKKSLVDKLTEQRTQQVQREFENAVLEQLVEHMTAVIPDGMINYRAEQLFNDYAARITGAGMDFDEYLKMMGQTRAGMQQDAREAAANQVKSELALEAVAKAENMEVTQEEMDAEIAKLAEQYKMDAEQVKNAITEEDLRHDLLIQKATEFVVANAKVGEAPKKKDEQAEAETAEKPKRTRQTAAKTADQAEEGKEKKPAARKTAKKVEESGEKKPAAKKTTKKTAKEEE